MPGAMRLVDAFDEVPRPEPRRDTVPPRPRAPLRFRVLIERILVAGVVIGVLVCLAAVPVSFMISRHDRNYGAIPHTREQIRIFATSLDMYHMDNDRYPSTEQGLQALITPPAGAPGRWKQYLNVSTLPLDPWGHDYIYERVDANDFSISSMGPDGLLATEDDIVAP